MALPDPGAVTRALLRGASALALCAALMLGAHVAFGSPDQPGISLRQEGPLLVVRNPFYTLGIQPANGGRIVSCVFDGAEMTRICPDGRGGLLGEVHAADMPFEVVQWERRGNGIVLELAADAGDLHLGRQFEFDAGRPWFTVRLVVENRSPHALGGSALAVRHLVEPGGPEAAGQQLYCLDRGLGSEILSPEVFLGRLHAERSADRSVRWMAVAEPAARRALGFVLPHAGCAPLRPERTDGGGMTFGWSYPPLPAGHRLRSTVVVVPLKGFAAVSKLNELVAADSLLHRTSDRLRADLHLMPLKPGMKGVSLITRAFDRSAGELDPFDPLLFDSLEPLGHYRGQVSTPLGERTPAWLVHELYSEGTRVGRFAVPVDAGDSGFPDASDRLDQPVFEPIEGAAPAGPGALIPVTAAQRERGFLLWRFDGLPARREVRQLDLALTRGERKTVFLGMRALRPIESFRLALAGLDSEPAGAYSIPPSAVYLWRLHRSGHPDAFLTPLEEVSLQQDEVAWLALTADASRLQQGRYAARLVGASGQLACEIPLSLEVVAGDAPAADAFGLWYLGDGDGAQLPRPVREKLPDYGVSALTLGASDGPEGGQTSVTGEYEELGLSLLSFASGGAALPPHGPSPGVMLLPHVQPVWLLRAWGAARAALPGSAAAGYAPALVCDRLTSLPSSLHSPGTRVRFWLVKDGCEPGRAAQMIESRVMDPLDSVWLHLDLAGANWQRAAIEIRSALWAAAWQELAGVAVSCAQPFPEVDRQLVLWHILRDARNEAALWRQLRAAAQRRAGTGPADGRKQALLVLSALESVLGPDERCDLVVRPRRTPFRTVYRISRSGSGPEPALDGFEAARRKVVELSRQLQDTEAAPSEQLYWGGIPLVEDGRVQWAVVALEGEAAWKTAMGLQRAVQERTGMTVPVSRVLPRVQQGGPAIPALTWVVAGDSNGESLPEAVRTALSERPDAPLVTVELEGGVVAILRNGRSLGALVRTLREERDLYSTAQHVR